MNLHIEPVTGENRDAVLALRVAPSQRGFIETTAQCLEEAAGRDNWRPVGIYDGAALVGFAMYGLFPEEGTGGRVWLDRLLIDARFQSRHYGTAALEALLLRLRAEYACDRVFLSMFDGNDWAQKMYERHGFAFNGELDSGGERVMVRAEPERN